MFKLRFDWYIIVNVYVPAIAKCLQENLFTSGLLPVTNNKQQADVLKSNVYGGIGFCKEEAKTFGQLLLHWEKRIMAVLSMPCKLSWTLFSPAWVQPPYGAGRKESSGTGLFQMHE